MTPLVIDKELLRPGVVYYPRTGPVQFSDDEVEEIYRSSQALHDSGRRASVPYEHRNDAKPVKLSQEDQASELTKYNSGWAAGYYRKPDGTLWGKIEVRDPFAIEKIKSGCYEHVSPEITGFFPADGRVWRNVITHIALTHKPVWKEQTPFQVPPGWVGADGAALTKMARFSLLDAGTLRLSLEDASPPDGFLDALQFGYRIPGNDTGVWVRDGYHERHVPKKVLDELDDDERRDLLRKMSVRHGRRLPRDFAGLIEPGESRPFTPTAVEVPASHLSYHDALPPFARPHPEGEPLLVWEDPADGRTHLVGGHDAHRKLPADPESRVSVVRVPGGSPYEARGGALMSHLLSGSAHPDDLADFFHDGAGREDLLAALKDHGHEPDPKLLQHAWELSLRSGPQPQLMAADSASTPAASDDTSGERGEAAASLFAHEPGYDPDEHRWQHWLQSEFPDPAARAHFAAAHGGDRPATHDDFLARKSAHEKQRLSHGGDVMFDYESMTEPKGDDKPKGDEKAEKKEAPEGEGKKDGPPSGGPKSSKVKHFDECLKLLKDDFNVDLPADTSEENGWEKLHAALTALKHAGSVAGEGGKPGEVELKPEAPGGGMQYSLAQKDVDSLKRENEALKAELTGEARKTLALTEIAGKQQFSLIETDLKKHQAKGHCTKAEVDDWLARYRQVTASHRFSILAPAESPAMVGLFAEIKQMKKVPDGTYTSGVTGDVVLRPETATTEERLSLGTEAQTSAEEQARLDASRRYFETEIWSQLGIPSGNGKK